MCPLIFDMTVTRFQNYQRKLTTVISMVMADILSGCLCHSRLTRKNSFVSKST